MWPFRKFFTKKQKKVQEDKLIQKARRTIAEQENMLRVYKNRITELEEEVKVYRGLCSDLKAKLDRVARLR